MNAKDKTAEQKPPIARVVERNINSLLQRRKQEEGKNSLEEKLADRVTGFTGS